MKYEYSQHIDTFHPCLAGHFPGNPVVPGVVVLDHVITTIELRFPETHICAVPRVKFFQPLRPGENYILRLAFPNQDFIDFDCVVDTTIIVSGRLALNHTDLAPRTDPA